MTTSFMTTSIRHTKTLLSSAAALAILLSAPSAFAQDAKVKTDVEIETEETMHEAIDSDDAAEDLEDATEDAVEMADEKADDRADEGMKTEDHAIDTDVEVKMDPVISTTIPCPEGTEIQDDGSCMLTEDGTPDE